MASLLPAALQLFASLKRFFPGSRSVARSPYGVLLPREHHKVLTEDDIGGRRLIIIGDVHGCCDELIELLDQENVSVSDNDTCVIFVGDLINKGPKNAQVVKLARQLLSYSVRGNHDEVCLREWEMAQQNGGQLSDKFSWMNQLSTEDINWLYCMPYTISVPSRNFIVVHAGLVPGRDIQDQGLEEMITMRNVIEKDGIYTATKSNNDGVCWASKWEGPIHVYFGHDARRLLQTHPFATGLDTGCVYGGHLTAIYPLSGKLVSVKCHDIYKSP